MKVHLDTDFAGDTDDAAALVMLLGWSGIEIVGITTVADPDGRRASYVRYVLGLAGRETIPVEAGAGRSLTTGGPMGEVPDHDRYWGTEPVAARPPSEKAAVELLVGSVEAGAVVIGIGPYTNLASLEAAWPGALGRVRVVLMGGWVRPPVAGLPPWGPEMDWNVQCDARAALDVFGAAGSLELVTLPGTLHAHLRATHLERPELSGPLGRLLVRQARAHAEDYRMTELGRAHPGLPDDLVNFQYDPVACAVALGWPAAAVETMHLRPRLEERVLRFEESSGGKPTEVVTGVDSDAFADLWLGCVESADQRAGSGVV